VADDGHQIPGRRIAVRAEHAHEALHLPAGRGGKGAEADRRIDTVAQDRLSGIHIARQQGFDAFRQQRHLKRAARAWTVPLNARVSAISPLAFPAVLVVSPALVCGRNVALLPLLRATGEQDHQPLTILPEIDPVARAEVDLQFQHGRPDAPGMTRMGSLQIAAPFRHDIVVQETTELNLCGRKGNLIIADNCGLYAIEV